MLILIVSGTKALARMNSFFFLNLITFSVLSDFSDVELACVGRGLGALGVVLASDWVFLSATSG